MGCFRSSEFKYTQPSSLPFPIQVQINTRRENGVSRILGIPVSTLLNSGNFSSTTTEKSTFLDTESGSDFGDIEKDGNMAEALRKQQRFKEIALYFFTFSNAPD